MALDTVPPECRPMDVFVAGNAVAVKPDPAGDTLADGEAGRLGNPEGGIVALGALHLPVALLELPSGARVVETLRRTVRPLDHGEIRSRVLRMARCTLLSGPRAVKTQPLLDQPSDILVTANA